MLKKTHFSFVTGLSLFLAGCAPERQLSEQICKTPPFTPVTLQGGSFTMGTNEAYPEEKERSSYVVDFNIDPFEVTNLQFSKFVKETGYVTRAEKLQSGFGVPGAAVFMPPTADHGNWWRFVEGANWRNPEGPDSSIEGQDHYPVVQVSFEDAMAYANWAGRDLPSEAEWEYAAKAGSDTLYVWGEDRTPNGKEMANTWQGAFPLENTNDDGFNLRAPVGCFPQNDFGLYDMIGNVWEWTKSDVPSKSAAETYVIKGGSYLCAENYCARYRSAARQFQESDFPTNHIGFRTVSRSALKTD